jgi:hypothetical protein
MRMREVHARAEALRGQLDPDIIVSPRERHRPGRRLPGPFLIQRPHITTEHLAGCENRRGEAEYRQDE